MRPSARSRFGTETNDRQFVDIYILDGLRAKDVIDVCRSSEVEFSLVASTKWMNALDDLGQRVLAADSRVTEASKLVFAGKAVGSGNIVFASDIVASLVRSSASKFDFDRLEIKNGDFRFFPLGERAIENLHLKDCYFGELAFPANNWVGATIEDCLAQRVTGVSSAAAFPTWIKNVHADEFDSVESVSRIRKIGLKPAQEILITIIRKTFFQKGSGRKEEALLRGLGTLAAKSISTKILNIMIRENLLTTFKGSEGTVYAPVRSSTNRMQRILDELGGSQDSKYGRMYGRGRQLLYKQLNYFEKKQGAAGITTAAPYVAG